MPGDGELRQPNDGEQPNAHGDNQEELQQADGQIDGQLAGQIGEIGAGRGHQTRETAVLPLLDDVSGKGDDNEEDGEQRPGRHIVHRRVERALGVFTSDNLLQVNILTVRQVNGALLLPSGLTQSLGNLVQRDVLLHLQGRQPDMPGKNLAERAFRGGIDVDADLRFRNGVGIVRRSVARKLGERIADRIGGVFADAHCGAVGNVDADEVLPLRHQLLQPLLRHPLLRIAGQGHLEQALLLQLAGDGDAHRVLILIVDEKGDVLVRMTAERALLHARHHQHQGHGHQEQEQQSRLVAYQQQKILV